MILTEQIKTLNERLKNNYGRFEDGHAIWRIVFANDQREKRLGTYIDRDSSGNFIREVTEVREVPKYAWLHGKHVLERIMPVPYTNKYELLEAKTSYEPVWVFEDKDGKPLPPKWEVVEIVIEAVHRAALEAVGGRAKYKQTDIENPEKRLLEVDKLKDELFGNETDTGDALAHHDAIVVPGNYNEVK